MKYKNLIEELKSVKWPDNAELFASFAKSTVFTAVFALFFVLCDFVSALLFKVI